MKIYAVTINNKEDKLLSERFFTNETEARKCESYFIKNTKNQGKSVYFETIEVLDKWIPLGEK